MNRIALSASSIKIMMRMSFTTRCEELAAEEVQLPLCPRIDVCAQTLVNVPTLCTTTAPVNVSSPMGICKTVYVNSPFYVSTIEKTSVTVHGPWCDTECCSQDNTSVTDCNCDDERLEPTDCHSSEDSSCSYCSECDGYGM